MSGRMGVALDTMLQAAAAGSAEDGQGWRGLEEGARWLGHPGAQEAWPWRLEAKGKGG